MSRYQELQHLEEQFTWNVCPRQGHVAFAAEPQTEEAAAMTAEDVLLLASAGEAVLGGHCQKTPQGGFVGRYNTD